MPFNDLIINGNFETGLLAPWISLDALMTAQYSHSGAFAVQLTEQLSYSFIYQYVPAESGERYEFFVSLAKAGTDPSPQVSMIILFSDSVFNYLGHGLLLIIPPDFLPKASERNWIEVYQTTNPAPIGTTQALVFVSKQAQADSADIVVDDVSLLAVEGIAGATGPAGPAGSTGPTGATGPIGPPAQFSGIQGQYITGAPQTISDGGVIPFNTVINNRSVNLSLNTATGEINIASPGNYYVSWWIAVDGSTIVPAVTFDLQLGGSTHSSASTPILSDQLSGSDFITVALPNTVLTLVNSTGNDVFIGNTAVQANIVILELST